MPLTDFIGTLRCESVTVTQENNYKIYFFSYGHKKVFLSTSEMFEILLPKSFTSPPSVPDLLILSPKKKA